MYIYVIEDSLKRNKINLKKEKVEPLNFMIYMHIYV